MNNQTYDHVTKCSCDRVIRWLGNHVTHGCFDALLHSLEELHQAVV